MRPLIAFLAGALALVVIVCGGGLVFLKTRADRLPVRASSRAFWSVGPRGKFGDGAAGRRQRTQESSAGFGRSPRRGARPLGRSLRDMPCQ